MVDFDATICLPPVRNYLRSAAWDRGSGERRSRNFGLAHILFMLNEPAPL